jgi:hypothetical protein
MDNTLTKDIYMDLDAIYNYWIKKKLSKTFTKISKIKLYYNVYIYSDTTNDPKVQAIMGPIMLHKISDELLNKIIKLPLKKDKEYDFMVNIKENLIKNWGMLRNQTNDIYNIYNLGDTQFFDNIIEELKK